MHAISGTRRAMKEMADGTIRVQVDIDPSCRGAFLSLFPNIDMPVALAPLVADFEQQKPDAGIPASRPKGGELARLAALLCQNAEFLAWQNLSNESNARAFICLACGVESRADLDNNPEAAVLFHENIRKPFLAWKEARTKGVAYAGEGRA